MEATRRSFFEVLGISGAAAAALPEPREVFSLKPGGIYVLTFDKPVPVRIYEQMRQSAHEAGERVGCKFIVLPHDVKFADGGFVSLKEPYLVGE